MYSSNIDDLGKGLKRMFSDMLNSKELQSAGKDAQDIMYKNVMNRVAGSHYDMNQSGQFKKLLMEQKDGYVETGRSTMKVGFGYLYDMNDEIFMRPEQSHTVRKSKGYISITTKAETEMPKWIVLEFGTRGYSERVPKEFQLNYTRRSDKQALIGPSGLLRNMSNLEKNRASSEGRNPDPNSFSDLRKSGGFHGKSTYFMASDRVSNMIYNDDKPRRHPGTKPTRVFRGGLEDSKEPIYDKYGEAIRKYLARQSIR